MTVSIFMKFKSVVSVIFGIGTLLAGGWLVSLFGATVDSAGMLFVNYTGACFLGIGLICWFVSNTDKNDLRQGVLLSLLICDSIGFVVALLAQLAGVTNALGWFNVGIWLVLALGLGYCRFLAKD
ncbi:MAG: hypothetical protein CVV44_06680 [Spirochaetae bacterium HGW-Spirochaetae-1]|nr:MAG: hypothetical protein CVV44_06680 [Spirochaetae bacterium HGW-Spirochaetae-1]